MPLPTGGGRGQIDDLGEQTKLRDGERTKLYLESDQPLQRRHDCGRPRTLALIGLDRVGDAPQHPEEKRAGPDGGVGQCDAARRETAMKPEPRG